MDPTLLMHLVDSHLGPKHLNPYRSAPMSRKLRTEKNKAIRKEAVLRGNQQAIVADVINKKQ